MKDKRTSLSIFDTFKTKGLELTGEATRQRSIIVALATQSNPTERTRTAISQRIAEENGTVWKNIYSGIFRDLDEILIPLNLVKEEGRLPLKRGPKALQEKGIPYYQLTPRGMLVSLSLDEIAGREKMLKRFFADIECEAELRDGINRLAEMAPKLAHSLIEKYVKAFCTHRLDDLLPLNFEKLRSVSDESLLILKEILDGFVKRPKKDREVFVDFLDRIASVKPP